MTNDEIIKALADGPSPGRGPCHGLWYRVNTGAQLLKLVNAARETGCYYTTVIDPETKTQAAAFIGGTPDQLLKCASIFKQLCNGG